MEDGDCHQKDGDEYGLRYSPVGPVIGYDHKEYRFRSEDGSPSYPLGERGGESNGGTHESVQVIDKISACWKGDCDLRHGLQDSPYT